jgi:hypothetical protein
MLIKPILIYFKITKKESKLWKLCAINLILHLKILDMMLRSGKNKAFNNLLFFFRIFTLSKMKRFI